ncbi:MAG: glycosyltransferase family 39 protein [Candidatus Omnitrophica bacterium]|nr:glycosyltransferase family 39 protein [Candidatus Omnitrophota bacterium]
MINLKWLISESCWKIRVRLALFGIIVLGAALRLWGLDIQSFWNDELGGWVMSHQQSLGAVVSEAARIDFHPPGYHIFQYFIEKCGSSEVILRLPAAICGTLSIGVVFLVGRRLFSWREGLVAALLMALLKCPIYYSQEARPYAMLLLLSLLAVYFWLSIVQDLLVKGKIVLLDCGVYLLIAVIICYLHYYGVLLVVLQGVTAALFYCRERKGFFFLGVLYSIVFLAYVPWISVGLHHAHQLASAPSRPVGIIETYNMYLKFIFNDSQWLVLFVVVVYFLMLLGCLCTHAKRDKENELLLFGWLIVPFLGVYFISYFTPLHILKNYCLIISLPAAYLLLARSVVLSSMSPFIKVIGVTAVSLGLLYHLVFGLKYYSEPKKTQFREAVAFVTQNDRLLKGSVILGSLWVPRNADYYFQRQHSDRRIEYNIYDKDQKLKASGMLAHQFPENIWYIYLDVKADQEFIDLMMTQMKVVEFKKFVGGGVYLFQKKGLKNES